MVRTYLKTFGRMFKKHFTRLVSIVLMVLVSVGFSAGIGMGKDSLVYSLSDYYKSQNVSDFVVRGAEIPEEKLNALEERFGEENVTCGSVFELVNGKLDMGGMTLKLEGEGIGEGVTRIYIQETEDREKLNIAERRDDNGISDAVPDANEFLIAAEHANRDIAGVPLGSKLTLKFEGMPFGYQFTVAETIVHPLHFAQSRDVSMQKKADGGEDDYELLENILYVYTDETHALPFPVNEIYISVPALKEHTLFDDGYEKKLSDGKAEIEDILEEERRGDVRRFDPARIFHLLLVGGIRG